MLMVPVNTTSTGQGVFVAYDNAMPDDLFKVLPGWFFTNRIWRYFEVMMILISPTTQ